MLLVDIAFGLNVAHTFQYSCPDGLEYKARPGMRAVAPLAGRTATGIIMSTGIEPKVERLRSLLDIPDEEPLLDTASMALLEWAAARYLAPLGAIIRAAVPRSVLGHGGPLPPESAAATVTASSPAAQALSAAEPAVRYDAASTAELRLGLVARAYQRIVFQAPPQGGSLDFFLEAGAASLAEDGQLLILVPDVSMAAITAAKLSRRWPDSVAVYHGALTPAQHRRAWLAARRNQVKVVVGCRSAVFLPLPRLAAVLVDDEHDAAYKSGESPRYQARDVAVAKGRFGNVPVVLASSSPSMETHYLRGRPQVIDVRIMTSRPPSSVSVIDMTQEKSKRRPVLSGFLSFRLRDSISRGQNAVLLVTRKGLAAAVYCRDCSYSPSCQRCLVPLAWPDASGPLVCRFCGYREDVPSACPRCSGTTVKLSNLGTRGVEREVKKLVPSAPTAILDGDMVKAPGDMIRILSGFNDGRGRILIGTQLLARCLPFSEIGLVGVVDADSYLFRPDFRAAERTFHMLIQALGLASRGAAAGTLVIQTHHPGNHAVQAVLAQDADIFYSRESAGREEAGFPPCTHLILVTLEDKDTAALDKRADAFHGALVSAQAEDYGVTILGPHPAPAAFRRGRHRRQFLLKGPDRELLADLVRRALPQARRRRGAGAATIVDVDPIDFA